MLLKIMMADGFSNGEPMDDSNPMKPCKITDNVRDVTSYRNESGEMVLQVRYKSEVNGTISSTITLEHSAYLMNEAGKTVQTFHPASHFVRTDLNSEERALFLEYKQHMYRCGIPHIKAEASFVKEYAATKKYALMITLNDDVNVKITDEIRNAIERATKEWKEKIFKDVHVDFLDEQGILISIIHNLQSKVTTPAAETPPDYAEWVANKPVVPGNLIAAITKWPSSISDQLKAALQSIIERRASSVYGLTKSLRHKPTTLEPVLPEDQKLTYDVFFDGIPTFSINELIGYPIFTAFQQFAMNHLNGKTKKELVEDGLEITFIEPEITHKVVMNAWVLQGVFIHDMSDIEGVRTQELKSMLSYSIRLDGTHMQDESAIMSQAQKLLDEYNAINVNPYLKSQAAVQ